jgi:hypothetical protein
MGFLNKLLGFRWSIYFVRNKNQLIYAMHENSVMELIDYVMVGYFKKGEKPVEPWSLYLNFNRKNKSIKLGPEHFNGLKKTPTLINAIQTIDPDWDVRRGEPVLIEVATKKYLKIRGPSMIELMEQKMNPQEILDIMNSEPDFYSVMDKVFGMS